MTRELKTKPRPETMQPFLAARRRLEKKLERAPTTTELGEALGISRERASQLLSAANLPTYKTSIKLARADISNPIRPEIKGAARLLIENMRQLYTAELKRPKARTDAELGALFGYGGRPDQKAAQFRRLIGDPHRNPPITTIDLAAEAFGVKPARLMRPLPGESC